MRSVVQPCDTRTMTSASRAVNGPSGPPRASPQARGRTVQRVPERERGAQRFRERRQARELVVVEVTHLPVHPEEQQRVSGCAAARRPTGSGPPSGRAAPGRPRCPRTARGRRRRRAAPRSRRGASTRRSGARAAASAHAICSGVRRPRPGGEHHPARTDHPVLAHPPPGDARAAVGREHAVDGLGQLGAYSCPRTTLRAASTPRRTACAAPSVAPAPSDVNGPFGH